MVLWVYVICKTSWQRFWEPPGVKFFSICRRWTTGGLKIVKIPEWMVDVGYLTVENISKFIRLLYQFHFKLQCGEGVGGAGRCCFG